MVKYSVTVTLSKEQRTSLPGMKFTLGVRKGPNGALPNAVEWLSIPVEGEKVEFGWEDSLELFETRTVIQAGVAVKQTDKLSTNPGDVFTYTLPGGFKKGAPTVFASIPVDPNAIVVYNLSPSNLKIGVAQGAEVNGVKTNGFFTVADVLANTGIVTFNMDEQLTLVWSTSYSQQGCVSASSSTAPRIDTLSPAEPQLDLIWDGTWVKQLPTPPAPAPIPAPITAVVKLEACACSAPH